MLIPETTVEPLPAPNAILIPQIIIQTVIANGELHSSINVGLMGGFVELIDGKPFWRRAAGEGGCYIPDTSNLDDDLITLDADIKDVEARIIAVVGKMNAIRRCL